MTRIFTRVAFACSLIIGASASKSESADASTAAAKGIALIGNSMIPAALEPGQINSAMKNGGVAFWKYRNSVGSVTPEHTVVHGPKSAFDFCAVYNQATRTDANKPGYLLIMVRNADETTPNMRIWGGDGCGKTDSTKYRNIIISAIGGNAKLRAIVDSVAYNDSLTNLWLADKKAWGYRGNQCADNQINWDFGKANPTSFLPRMVQVCKQNNVKLIILLHPTYSQKATPDYYKKFPERDKYRKDMAAYLGTNGMHALDYFDEKSIDVSWYAGVDNDHIGASGKPKYVKLVAEDLDAIIAGVKAPREVSVGGSTSSFKISTQAGKRAAYENRSVVGFGYTQDAGVGDVESYNILGKEYHQLPGAGAGIRILKGSANR